MSQDKLTQSPKSVKRKPLTAERLRKLLHYEPETGIWTRLVVMRGDNIIHCPRAEFGSRPKSIDKDGYLQFYVDGKRYQSHRLAFLYMTGSWPKAHVDHNNVVPGDDRWANLREATPAQNQHNRKRQSNNVSGVKGVCWWNAKRRWSVRVGNKYVGIFADLEKAKNAYREAALKRWGEFARFD